MDDLRRHAGAGARRFQHRTRAQRRYPDVSRGRPFRAAERPHARGGCYFDAIVRQAPIDDDNLNVEDNLEEFGADLRTPTLAHFAGRAERLRRRQRSAIFANFGGMAFGDIALVPAPCLNTPRASATWPSGT